MFGLRIKKVLICILVVLSLCLYGQEDACLPCEKKKLEEDANLFCIERPAFLINGECIYWTVEEGALDYAVQMTEPAWGPTPALAQGNITSIDFNWNAGYRASIGYFRAPRFWEILGEYTFIHFSNDRMITRDIGSELFLNGTYPSIFTSPITIASSQIHLHYQLVNLLAKRVFSMRNNPHLRMRLFGGPTATWIHQSWRIEYRSAIEDSTTINNRWRYWGFGLRTGVQFDWFWGCDIYTTGLFSTALVVGHYRNQAKQRTNRPINPADDPTVPIGNAHLEDYRLSFTVQFLLGPSYQKSFQWGRVELFAGYEFTIWTNLQEVYRSIPSNADAAKQLWINKGLLSMHGLTTRLTINF